jgi:DNA-binding HxlR family transcriptional regulator
MVFSMSKAPYKSGLEPLKISSLIENPSVKILLHINTKGEVRFTDLTMLIDSRGALSTNLRALEIEGLTNRRVVTSKPIQAYYSLTEKGKMIARNFLEIKDALSK